MVSCFMNYVLATEKNCNRLSYEIKIHKKKKNDILQFFTITLLLFSEP